jgi:hypothetical protein
MKTILSTAMRKAAKLTQSRQVIEATRVIQRALAGRDLFDGATTGQQFPADRP